MKRVRSTPVDPIPKGKVREWNKLIAETKEAVCQRDKHHFALVLLAGRVEKVFGEARVKRWAEEAGVSYQSAKQYRWMANRGVDEEFIKRWVRSDDNKQGLNYAVIRTIIGFVGSTTSEVAVEYLTWAQEHKATEASMRAYLNELIAPNEAREQHEKDFKVALQTKKELEGFSDQIAAALERIIEEHPELEHAVMDTVVTKAEDVTQLKREAGILTDDEQEIVDETKRLINRVKTFRRHFRDNKRTYERNIEYGHEFSQELWDQLHYLSDQLQQIMVTKPAEFDIPDENVVEVDFG